LECFYSNAYSIRNKYEEIEALAQSQTYDITGVSKTSWEKFRDRCAVMDSYKLFRIVRQGRQGRSRGVLCVIEGLDCMEFTQKLSTLSSPTAKIKGKANDVDIVLRIYYRPPNQEDDTN